MQAGVVLSLVELTESPAQEVARPAGVNREVSRANIEKMHGMMAAKGNATTKGSTRFHHMETEPLLHTLEARNRGGDACETTAYYAYAW